MGIKFSKPKTKIKRAINRLLIRLSTLRDKIKYVKSSASKGMTIAKTFDRDSSIGKS
jgi:hypothetical protein